MPDIIPTGTGTRDIGSLLGSPPPGGCLPVGGSTAPAAPQPWRVSRGAARSEVRIRAAQPGEARH
jgi:hypothetical protein